MAWTNIIVFFTILSLVVITKQDTEYDMIRIVVQSKEMYLNGIRQSLGKYLFFFDSKINYNLFIFVKESYIPKHRLMSSDLEKLQRSNRHIKNLAQRYKMYPASPLIPQSAANDSDEQQSDQWNASNGMILCPPFFDQALGIDDSWIKHNVSGRGIVVGVTDVGINANNAFIRKNINSDLSYNFVDNIPQAGPTSLPDKKESSLRTGHAIACAGLIARPKTGDKCVPCGLGVAHGAKVADLQIAKSEERTWLTQSIDSAFFSRALAHRRDAFQIFSNSWATPRVLRKSDFYEKEVLTEGIREGRQGLGTVYVFPAGQPGLANHIESITVACLGVNGSVADVSAVNAATLVSVFCNGRKRTDQRMITVGQDERRCETNFGGESAATAIVSGMIALLLEANQTNDLGWYVHGMYEHALCYTTPIIEKMEEVLVEIEFVYSEQHHMKLWAKSPSGTESTLANIKPFVNGDKARRVNTTFRSNHFWGENSEGLWHVNIGCNSSTTDPLPENGCRVANTRLVIYGTMGTGNKQQYCNKDTYQELDVDTNKIPSDASDGKHIANSIKNNVITNVIVSNNNGSFLGLWIFCCIVIAFMCLWVHLH